MNSVTILLIFCVPVIAFAQNQPKIDSLNNELRKYEAWKKALGANAQPMMDTTKTLLLNDLNREFRDFDKEKGLEYAKQCLELSERIGFKKGIAHGYNDYGLYFFREAKFKEAESYYNQSLKLRLELHDADGIASSYNNLALHYGAKGDDARSLSYYQTSLQYCESGGSKRMMAAIYHNMGLVYAGAGNTQEALENFNKAKKINTEIGNKVFLSYNLGSLSGMYQGLKQYNKVIDVNQELLKLNQELYGNSFTPENATIGDMYYKLNNYPEAMRYYQMVLADEKKFPNEHCSSQIHLNIGKVYHKQNNLPEAMPHLKQAIVFADRVDRPDLKRESLEILADIYGKQGNLRAAWQSHVESVALKDTTDESAAEKEKAKRLTLLLMQSSFDKEKDSIQAINEKREIVQNNIRNSVVTALVGSFIFLFVVYRQRNMTRKEKQRSENLLLNILPAEVAEELKEKGRADAKHFDNVTVLFTDFKSFTTVSEQLTPQELVDELHECFKSFDEIITKYNIEKIKTIGDAYLAVCGLPVADYKHAENVVNAALEIREFMEKRRQNLGEKTFEVRIGINSGSVVAGIVGLKKFAYDIWGDTVNTAARMEQHSEAGKINISETTYEIIKGKFPCEFRGEIDAKNKGKLKMYFVNSNLQNFAN
ncbi:MAG: tetratricopeptide repeat protein [Bacteroidetes bacterium]|nr:tetratricopeptide repeat protein [Bacteroidota bacterium]